MNELENLWTKFLRLVVNLGTPFIGGGLAYLYNADLIATDPGKLVILFCAYGGVKAIQGIIDFFEEPKTTAGKRKKTEKTLSWYFK